MFCQLEAANHSAIFFVRTDWALSSFCEMFLFVAVFYAVSKP
jgi:hypothetical protein